MDEPTGYLRTIAVNRSQTGGDDRRAYVFAAKPLAKEVKNFEDVIPTVKGTDRVAVIGVGLNDVLVSVIAVDASGKDTTVVTGTLPGDSTLPFNFGGESGSNGSISMSAVTTIAPPLFLLP